MQKLNQDVLEAYAMIDDVMKSLESTRTTIDTVFESWYDEVLMKQELQNLFLD